MQIADYTGYENEPSVRSLFSPFCPPSFYFCSMVFCALLFQWSFVTKLHSCYGTIYSHKILFQFYDHSDPLAPVCAAMLSGGIWSQL